MAKAVRELDTKMKCGEVMTAEPLLTSVRRLFCLGKTVPVEIEYRDWRRLDAEYQKMKPEEEKKRKKLQKDEENENHRTLGFQVFFCSILALRY